MIKTTVTKRGQPVVASVIRRKFNIGLDSTMSIVELYYVTYQEKGEVEAASLILLVRGLPLKGLPLGEDLVLPASSVLGRICSPC